MEDIKYCKLKQTYRQLSGIEQDIAEYIEECDNDKLASDVAGKVANLIETALFELNCIIDDRNAGLYDPVDTFEEIEEEEEF